MILDIENPVANPIRSYIGYDLVWVDTSDMPADLFLRGEQGVWFDPSDLSTMFQDVSGTVPVTKDGDPVALMKDKSGNGNHATQETAAARPIYKTDGNLHWLEFDGIDDFMLSNNARFSTPLTQVLGFKVSTTQRSDYGAIQGTGMLSDADGFGGFVDKLNNTFTSSLRINAVELAVNSIALPDGAVVAYSIFTDSKIETSVNNLVFSSDEHSLGSANSNVGMTIGARIRPNNTLNFHAKMNYYGSVVVARDLTPNAELLSYMDNKTGVTL